MRLKKSPAQANKGIQRMALSPVQLDQMAPENAALVEESSAAAHSPDQQARTLAGAVNVLKV